MNNSEKQLLERAAHEIKSLRNQNERMSLRLQMFDQCMQLVNLNTDNRNCMMPPDLVWEIEKFIKSDEATKTDTMSV